MAKHFGYGDYERIDVKVRLSTWFMRHYFLQTLVERKDRWAKDLTRLINYKILPSELLEEDKADSTFYAFFAIFCGYNPFNVEIRADLLDTPLKAFFYYLEEKKDEIDKLKDEEIAKNYIRCTNDTEKKAIEKLLPNWKTLKKNKEAESLCLLLENWAEEFNLNADWCLDFILMVLINFKISIASEVQRFNKDYTKEQDIKSLFYRFDLHLRKALQTGLNDFYHNIIIKKWNIFDKPESGSKLTEDPIELPEFVFKHEDFEVPPVTWFPHIIRRKEFTEETELKYDHLVEAITDLQSYPGIDEKAFIKPINEYCDEIEKHISETANPRQLFPYTVNHLEILMLFSSTWEPSKILREQFIKNYIQGLKNSFEKYKEMGKSIGSLKKEEFQLALFSYCNKVEKQMPKNYAKIPSKYTEDKHFNWLVDNQVTPSKSYKEIVNEIDITERPSIPAIRTALTRLCKIIGLPRRQTSIAGRPAGIIERKKRHVVKK